MVAGPKLRVQDSSLAHTAYERSILGMEDIGFLREQDGRFEFHYEALGLVIRGTFAEWVLEAAAEVIGQTEKLQTEGRIDELATLCEFGEASELEVDSIKYDAKARFEVIPQCVVTMGTMDYKWISAVGRTEEPLSDQPIKRIHDMSLTRNNTFLANEDDVDTSGT